MAHLQWVVVDSENAAHALLLMSATIAIATHDGAGENGDMAQAPAAGVFPHVGQSVRAPRPNCVVGLRE
eukprot:COSAG03_NODE_1_length_29615_cov_14.578263_12_plen_69_part_00